MKMKMGLLSLLAFMTAALPFMSADTAFSQDKAAATAGAPAPSAEEAKSQLATPQEFKSYLEAEKQAIAREREALLLLKMQVRQDIEKLQALQAQMDEKFTKEDAKQDERIKKMVKIYSVMRPDEVGPLIAKLDEDLALRVLFNMKPKMQADITKFCNQWMRNIQEQQFPKDKTNETSESRVWQCPECGHVEEIDQDWLADHGEPVCGKCDVDMKIQPKNKGI